MLPFRYLVQTVLGGEVDYISDTRTIIARVNGREIILQVDSILMTVDGMEQELSQAPTLVGDHTLVPLRAFDVAVTSIDWDGDAQLVTIVP